VEPAQELAIAGGLSSPGAQPVEPLVDTEVERDDLVSQDLARSWPAQVAHDLRVTVQVEKVADVVLGELADGKSRCLQDDVPVSFAHYDEFLTRWAFGLHLPVVLTGTEIQVSGRRVTPFAAVWGGRPGLAWST
jgi:hypothetical protein